MSYRKILLCVDNSVHSGYATAHAAAIARTTGATVVVSHVYAARLHDRRFADLEPGLPEEYQDPARLEQSRRTHDSLIGRGLRMISESYLAAARGRLDGLPVEGRNLEGKNYVELVRESADAYDLAVIGSRGLGLASLNGQGPPEAIGSVCERFLRRAQTDVFVARDARPIAGTILAGVDGSPESYAALRRALKLAKALDARVEAVSCFDPHFHPVAFQSIAAVLSEKDAQVFRFKEQENLHDRVINHGLENLYAGYLENARVVAKGRGQEVETRLLRGRPAYEIVRRAREVESTLVVVARHGLHRTDGLDIGGTAESLVRLAPCSVLVVNERPEETALAWTAEAEARLDRVPEFMRPMVKKAIESHARARGLTEITPDVVTDAKTGHGVPMPGHRP
ncbi:MAG: universal stress protein [Planctomycetes bacterium]|nr:universal stress protein [Planctomycetota bacterium]